MLFSFAANGADGTHRLSSRAADAAMLDGATWQASKLVVCRALNRSLDAESEIVALAKLLDGAYRTVTDRVASNPDLRSGAGSRKRGDCRAFHRPRL